MSVLVCDMKCSECKFSDCIIDSDVITPEEYRLSQSLDREITNSGVPREVLRKRESALAWYYRNRESDLKRKAEYRENNREKLREEAKQYYLDNKEQVKQRRLANYYSNHEESKKKSRDAKRERWNSNPEYYRQKQREYRQRVKERRLQNEDNKDQQTTSV